VAVRLFFVHTDPNSELTAEESAHIGEVELRVPRGEIRDRDGGLLAKDRRVYSLWADPRALADPEMTALTVGTRFGLNETDLAVRLAKRDEDGKSRKFVWIKRWLSDQDLKTFEALDPMFQYGLSLKNEWVRYYPEGELAAHIVGFVNREGNGCDGIEMSFNKLLRCTSGKQRSRVDANRNILRSLTIEYTGPEGGDTVYLTIDKTIQRTLERALDRSMVESNAPRAMGIVVDVKTGAILAMATRPAYDLNDHGDVTGENCRNRAAEFVFEPGSSFKIVAASAALDEGLLTTETPIFCENGSFNPYGHTIRDFHRLGLEPFSTCFAESSNIAIIKVGAMLGAERMEKWIRRFGFGARACLDLPIESKGIFRPRKQWSRLSMGSLPMGQEIAVTIPQLARGFCVIANGGYLRNLYYVDRAVARDGSTTYEHRHEEPVRVLSDATMKTMRQLCHLVVLHGTGRPACIPEYRVGGKTGTAQIANPGGRGFLPGKFTAIFAGFAPIADPRLCAVIVVQEPNIKLHFGGSICGPVFKEVLRDALIRMNVPPDPVQEEPGTAEAAPETEDEDTMVARETDESPSTPTQRLDDLALVDAHSVTSEGEPALPNFTGMTKLQAKELIDRLGIRWDPRGAGRVIAQDPPAGAALRDVTLCRLVFSNDTHEEMTTDESERTPKVARL